MGSLVLFSLPIGNKEDITERTRELLFRDGIFLAEDTRVLKDFIKLKGGTISGKKFISFHEHNDEKRLDYVLGLLEENDRVYLTSDAGSPVISDPAFPIIKAAIEKGHDLRNLPGVSSVTAALELSGLPPYPFTFHGFLPKEKGKRESRFQSLNFGVNIFFESPHRIIDSLKILSAVEEEFEVSVAREISKKFESVYRFKSKDFAGIEADITAKGEFVLCIYKKGQAGENTIAKKKIKDLACKYLSEKGSKKDLAKIFSEITGEKVKTIYDKLTH